MAINFLQKAVEHADMKWSNQRLPIMAQMASVERSRAYRSTGLLLVAIWLLSYAKTSEAQISASGLFGIRFVRRINVDISTVLANTSKQQVVERCMHG